MNLATGAKLGPYEILDAVGAGGMGEVYRARDTRLGRTVAVKVLPPHLASRLDFRERFEREARAASSLNHPNICMLFDIGSHDGIDFIVMEYLEGETLERRLAKGPMPLDQGLRCALGIADALAAAHAAGITHRDLKPSNVMLTKSGPKLLDFGLAKARPDEASRATDSQAATETAPLTAEGVIIGTPQYMSPEQIDGREIGPRTDIFAFGVTLYEMITGRKAFEGKSQVSLLAAILEREPTAMSVLQEATPPALDHLVRGCLVKAPEERWQSTRDIVRQLRWILDSERDSKQAAPLHTGANRRRQMLGVVAAGVLLAAVVLGVAYFQEPRADEETLWMSVLPPHTRFGTRPAPALSPDGTQLAFWAPDAAGDVQLWVRPLDSPTARVLAGATLGKETADNPTGALPPFWSPDGLSLGFFAESKLKRVDVAGGLPQELAPAPNPYGGTWNADGVILFSPFGIAIHRVSDKGGIPTPLYGSANATDVGTREHFPHFLPDGDHFLFFRQRAGSSGAVYLGSLDSTDVREVLAVDSRAEYADGHVFFGRNGELFAQAFDLGPFKVAGEAFRVADHLGAFINSVSGRSFSASGGKVAIWSGSWMPVTQLTWYDRSGKPLGLVGEAGVYGGFDLSPNGEHAAIEVWNQKTNQPEIWLTEMATGISSKFATNPAGSGANTPLWSANGSVVFFNAEDGSLRSQPARGTQADKIPVAVTFMESVSRDGRYLFFSLPNLATQGLDLGVLPLSGEPKVQRYEVGNQAPLQADPSPDGSWIAYMSNEPGTLEVYVDSFPKSGNKKRISANVGLFPKWSRDGKELYFLSYRGLESTLMVSTVTPMGTAIDLSIPRPLFAAPLTSDYWINDQFAPSPKGDRFLFNAKVDSATPPAITVISNWRKPN